MVSINNNFRNQALTFGKTNNTKKNELQGEQVKTETLQPGKTTIKNIDKIDQPSAMQPRSVGSFGDPNTPEYWTPGRSLSDEHLVDLGNGLIVKTKHHPDAVGSPSTGYQDLRGSW